MLRYWDKASWHSSRFKTVNSCRNTSDEVVNFLTHVRVAMSCMTLLIRVSLLSSSREMRSASF